MVGQVCDECRAAVLQLDLVGFTRMSARLPPMRLAQMVKPTCPSSSSSSGSSPSVSDRARVVVLWRPA